MRPQRAQVRPPSSPLPHPHPHPTQSLIHSPSSSHSGHLDGSSLAARRRNRDRLTRGSSSEVTVPAGLANWRRRPKAPGPASRSGSRTTSRSGTVRKARKGMGMGMQGTPAKSGLGLGSKSKSKSIGIHSTPLAKAISRTLSISKQLTAGRTSHTGATFGPAGSIHSSSSSSFLLPSSADIQTPTPTSEVPSISSPPSSPFNERRSQVDLFDPSYTGGAPAPPGVADESEWARMIMMAEEEDSAYIEDDEMLGTHLLLDTIMTEDEDATTLDYRDFDQPIHAASSSMDSPSEITPRAQPEQTKFEDEATTMSSERECTVYREFVVPIKDRSALITSISSRTVRRSKTIAERQSTPLKPSSSSQDFGFGRNDTLTPSQDALSQPVLRDPSSGSYRQTPDGRHEGARGVLFGREEIEPSQDTRGPDREWTSRDIGLNDVSTSSRRDPSSASRIRSSQIKERQRTPYRARALQGATPAPASRLVSPVSLVIQTTRSAVAPRLSTSDEGSLRPGRQHGSADDVEHARHTPGARDEAPAGLLMADRDDEGPAGFETTHQPTTQSRDEDDQIVSPVDGYGNLQPFSPGSNGGHDIPPLDSVSPIAAEARLAQSLDDAQPNEVPDRVKPDDTQQNHSLWNRPDILPERFTPSSHFASPRALSPTPSAISFPSTSSPSPRLITPPPPEPSRRHRHKISRSTGRTRKGAWRGADVMARMQAADRSEARYHLAYDRSSPEDNGSQSDSDGGQSRSAGRVRKSRAGRSRAEYVEPEELLARRRKRLAFFENLDQTFELRVELVL